MNAYAFRTAGTLVGIVTLFVATLCAAAEYPARPVRVIAPYAPGGGVDFTSRVVTQKLAAALGQTFVVDNRAGAASIIGTQIVLNAQPDGWRWPGTVQRIAAGRSARRTEWSSSTMETSGVVLGTESSHSNEAYGTAWVIWYWTLVQQGTFRASR